MSRVCIKGLPKDCTEAQLRAHIVASVSDVTDVKIARTKEGRSRQFAFIGFKEPESADKAIRQFNRAFFGSSRLAVETAREIGDDSVLQRAWSKHTKEKLGSNTDGTTSPANAQRKRPRPSDAQQDEQEKLFAELGLGKAARKLAMESGIKDASRLREFLAIAGPRNSAPTWVDDDAQARAALPMNSKRSRLAADHGPVSSAGVDVGSAEHSQNVRSKGKGKLGKRDEDEDDDGHSTDSEEYAELPASGNGADAPSTKNRGTKVQGGTTRKTAVTESTAEETRGEKGRPAGMTDLEYLKSKQKARAFDSDSEDGEGEGDDSEDEDEAMEEGDRVEGEEKQQVAQGGQAEGADDDMAGADEDVSESGRLFIRNLPYTVSEEELRAHFSLFGPLADVLVVKDSAGRCKGYGYVTYMIPEHAVLAMTGSDGKVFQGRLLHVLPAKAQPASEGDRKDGEPVEGGKSAYKSSKDEKRRAGAGSERESASVWNTLFIRSDAAIAAAAASVGVSRSELLDRDSKNTAVRAALAEATVIAETKKFLADEGVVLDRLEEALEAGQGSVVAAKGKGGTNNTTSAAGKRSDTLFMVKNLPADADVDALRELFTRHGLLARFVVPPSKVLALVEFVEPRHAKKAFAALAYARFQRVPLYLEWAPEATFSAPAPAPVLIAPVKAVPAAKVAEAVVPAVPASGKAGEAVPAPSTATDSSDTAGLATDGRTVFVKNLAFATTEEGLREVAVRSGPVRAVRIPKKKNPKYTGKGSGQQEWLSLGYGFVEYVRKEDADSALRTLQGVLLDGHALQLKISASKGVTQGQGTAQPAQQQKGGQPGDKKKSAVASTTSTKLMVRNLAFEATKNEVQELFQSFGTLRSVRLPRKVDGTGRGFAFVDFLTHEEAGAAKAALGAAHLYGRHLVIEWAAEGDGAGGDAQPPSLAAQRVQPAQQPEAPKATGKKPLDLSDRKPGELKLTSLKAPAGKKTVFV